MPIACTAAVLLAWRSISGTCACATACGVGPGPQIVVQLVPLKLRRVSGVTSTGVAAGARTSFDVAGQVGREFAGQVGAAAGLAGLVVVAELDQHVARHAGLAACSRAMTRSTGLRRGSSAAAPTARQVQAGQAGSRRSHKASP
jgi:hypothetical protein